MANRPTKAEMQQLKDDLDRVYAQLEIQRFELQAANEGWRLATERCADLNRTLKDLERIREQITRERDKANSDHEHFRKRVAEMCEEHQAERKEWNNEREILRGIIQMLAGRAK